MAHFRPFRSYKPMSFLAHNRVVSRQALCIMGEITARKNSGQRTKRSSKSVVNCKGTYMDTSTKSTMKKLVSMTDVPNEGLFALMGEEVMLFCANYIYGGRLGGVNDSCVLLSGAYISFETGPFPAKKYKDAQELPTTNWYVQQSAIESFGKDKAKK